MDNRDRRRRELGQPEPQEPPEKVEPSTSWWPVSSAEKKNVTLVRQGEQCSHWDACVVEGPSQVHRMSGSFHGSQPDKVLKHQERVSQTVCIKLEGESAHGGVPDTSDSATPTAHSRAS